MFAGLPGSLLSASFSFLGLRDLLRAKQVCHPWEEAKAAWTKFLEGHDVARVQPHCLPHLLQDFRVNSKADPATALATFLNLSTLRCQPFTGELVVTMPNSLQTLDVSANVFTPQLVEALSTLPGLVNLFVRPFGAPSEPASLRDVAKLHRLQVCMIQQRFYMDEGLEALARLTDLRHLGLRFRHFFFPERAALLAASLQKLSLLSVDVFEVGRWNPSVFTCCQALKSLALRSRFWAPRLEDLATMTKIECFTLMSEDASAFASVMQLAPALPALKKLTFDANERVACADILDVSTCHHLAHLVLHCTCTAQTVLDLLAMLPVLHTLELRWLVGRTKQKSEARFEALRVLDVGLMDSDAFGFLLGALPYLRSLKVGGELAADAQEAIPQCKHLEKLTLLCDLTLSRLVTILCSLPKLRHFAARLHKPELVALLERKVLERLELFELGLLACLQLSTMHLEALLSSRKLKCVRVHYSMFKQAKMVQEQLPGCLLAVESYP